MNASTASRSRNTAALNTSRFSTADLARLTAWRTVDRSDGPVATCDCGCRFPAAACPNALPEEWSATDAETYGAWLDARSAEAIAHQDAELAAEAAYLCIGDDEGSCYLAGIRA